MSLPDPAIVRMRREPMLTSESLRTAGYREWHDRTMAEAAGEAYVATFQKRITDDVGVRYWITATHLRAIHDQWSEDASRNVFTVHTQMIKNETEFGAEITRGAESVADVEAFFDGMWRDMGCGYCLRY